MTNRSRILFILRVSSRYLLSKRSGRSRLINLISFLGLVLGLTLLIVVLSVFNGIRDEREKYVFSVYPHAVARVTADETELLSELQSLPGVSSIEPFVDTFGLLNVERRVRMNAGVSVYGFNADSSNRIFRQMQAFIKDELELPPAGMDYNVAIGFGMTVGDTFTLTVPLVSEHGVQSKTVAFRYERPMWLGDHDQFSRIVYVRISDLLAHGIVSKDQIHHMITLDEPRRADQILGDYPEVTTWSEHFGSYFQALAMEKTILFILLLFAIGLVTMNIISGQAMLINRKSSDIAILQTMGAELRWISIVFMFQGAIVVVAGIIVGTILGCIAARYVHNIIQLFPLGGRGVTLRFDTATVALQDLIWTTSAALIVGLLAILRPLNLIFKKDPVESLNRMA
ncbi:MAG: ABC transporter permease [Gammaproteobacteria bacterium]|nr:ABC transporter permease [Gammaproteobacteria bacterium]